MIEVKPGVIFSALKQPIYGAFPLLDMTFARFGVNCVITSGWEGEDSFNSLHYQDLAIDLRSRHLTPAQQKEVLALLQHHLGGDYDVILEKDHFHLEYAPR